MIIISIHCPTSLDHKENCIFFGMFIWSSGTHWSISICKYWTLNIYIVQQVYFCSTYTQTHSNQGQWFSDVQRLTSWHSDQHPFYIYKVNEGIIDDEYKEVTIGFTLHAKSKGSINWSSKLFKYGYSRNIYSSGCRGQDHFLTILN